MKVTVEKNYCNVADRIEVTHVSVDAKGRLDVDYYELEKESVILDWEGRGVEIPITHVPALIAALQAALEENRKAND